MEYAADFLLFVKEAGAPLAVVLLLFILAMKMIPTFKERLEKGQEYRDNILIKHGETQELIRICRLSIDHNSKAMENDCSARENMIQILAEFMKDTKIQTQTIINAVEIMDKRNEQIHTDIKVMQEIIRAEK